MTDNKLMDCRCLDKEDKEIIIEDLKKRTTRLEKQFKFALSQSPIALIIKKRNELIKRIESTPLCNSQ